MNNKGSATILILVFIFLILAVGFIFFLNFKQKNGAGNISLDKNNAQKQERNFVALGASFTKANNISSKLRGDHPEYSFSTGTKVDSIYLYLTKRGEHLTPRNLAESGADSQKVLSQQIPNAVSFQPKYVTIDIMTDLFKEAEPIKFKQNLIEIIKQVKKQDTVVLISTYPNITSMRKATYTSCSEDTLHLGLSNLTEEKIKLFNGVIEEMATTYDLILVETFNTLGAQDVSDYDCLHPNIEGQKKLAKVWISALEEKGVNID